MNDIENDLQAEVDKQWEAYVKTCKPIDKHIQAEIQRQIDQQFYNCFIGECDTCNEMRIARLKSYEG